MDGVGGWSQLKMFLNFFRFGNLSQVSPLLILQGRSYYIFLFLFLPPCGLPKKRSSLSVKIQSVTPVFVSRGQGRPTRVGRATLTSGKDKERSLTRLLTWLNAKDDVCYL